MGRSAQQSFYNEWLDLSRPYLHPGEGAVLTCSLPGDAGLHKFVNAIQACVTCICLTADILSAVDDVAKVDTSNAVQVQRLYSAFSHNTATVNFWLRFVVFPAETNQYPQRLVANSWHLAEGSRVVGFSGTNDNHRLLPLQVHQAQLEEPLLQATNGKMLDVILKHTKGCTTLQVQVRRDV
jgi:hypothetical protein